MPGPPRQFDKHEALAACMQTFWAKGYQGTSYEDLVRASGVHRASIYAAFGGKADLFEAALQMYVDRGIAMMTECVRGQGSPLAGVVAGLQMIKLRASENWEAGCFCGNAAAEMAREHEGVARVVRNFYERFTDVYRHALSDAVQVGELPEDTDVEHWSLLILAVTQGLSNLAQSGVDQGAVGRLIEGLIRDLRAHDDSGP